MDMEEVLKKIRLDNDLTYEALGERLGVSSNFVSMAEKGKRKVSEKFLKTLTEQFPAYTKQLIEAYSKQNLPEELQKKFSGAKFENASGKVKEYKLKVYRFMSGGSGKINFDEYKEVPYILPFDRGDSIQENGYVFIVEGNSMEPYFFNDDTIVFLKENFESWEALDSRLILVKLGKDHYIRKLFFDEGKPYLYSFNKRLYPEMEVTKEVEFIAILDSQLERNVKSLKF